MFLFGQLKLIWYICEWHWSDIRSLKHPDVCQKVYKSKIYLIKGFDICEVVWFVPCILQYTYETSTLEYCMCGFVLLWCVLCGKCLDHFKKRVVSCPKRGALQFVAFKSVFEFGSWYVLHTCCMFFVKGCATSVKDGETLHMNRLSWLAGSYWMCLDYCMFIY